MSEHCEGCPKEADPAAMCLCDRIEALRQEHLNSVLPTLFALTARVALLESAEREVAALKAMVEEERARADAEWCPPLPTIDCPCRTCEYLIRRWKAGAGLLRDAPSTEPAPAVEEAKPDA